jgi:hypothetical protein
MEQKERKGDFEIEFVLKVKDELVDVQATYSNVTFDQVKNIIDSFESMKSLTWR